MLPAGFFITFMEVVWAIESHLDCCLGISVLCLQHLYCLPQLSQLRLLDRENEKETGGDIFSAVSQIYIIIMQSLWST